MSFSSSSPPVLSYLHPNSCSLFCALQLVYKFEIYLIILNYLIRSLHTCHNRCRGKSLGMKRHNEPWKCCWRTLSFFVRTAWEKQQFFLLEQELLLSNSYRFHAWSFVLHGTGRETLHLYCQCVPWPCKHVSTHTASADEARQSYSPSMTNQHSYGSTFLLYHAMTECLAQISRRFSGSL